MPTILDRIMAKVEPEPNTGCWLWMGALDVSGYARIRAAGRNRQAYRVAFELLRGLVPGGFELDHLCRVRCCVNPDHLEPVTRRVNQLRGFGASGVNARKSHCVHGHAFDESNTYRWPLAQLDHRSCKQCRHEASMRRVRNRPSRAAA